MKTLTNIIYPTLAAVALACFAFSAAVRAVDPPPDGGYPGGNTAEGEDALFSLTGGTETTAIGYQALYNNTYRSDNTAIGYRALFSNVDGYYNTATGVEALKENTSGWYNTANGFTALQKNTTGYGNTAAGAGTLNVNTTGNQNTGCGASAFNTNTTGNDNTAMGFNALYSNTTASQNTATGSSALYSNTTGSENTANGFETLRSNTTGSSNTAYGLQALYSNTTGFLNTAIGDQAFISNTTGARSLAVGNAALLTVTSGDSNTAVGNASLSDGSIVNFNTALGRRALFRNQGDQNIGLGFFVGSNLNGSGSNNIFIGNVGPVPIGSESNTIRIGQQVQAIATVGNPPVESHPMPAHTATFVAGIYGTTVSRGASVFVDANGRLGSRSSSARFKDEIKPMDKASEAIHALKPVTFRYKKEIDAERIPQFGLVAEDVEKLNPDLVVKDAEGKVYTVRYEAVNAMLLNEFLKEHQKVQRLEAALAAMDERLKAQDAKIERVNDKIELTKPAPQTALNNH